MSNICYGCGKNITITTAADRNTARFICNNCYEKNKKAKVKYKILYRNGFQEEIIQDANEEEIKAVNNIIYNSFYEGNSGVLSFGMGSNEGYIIRIEDISRISIVNN